MGNWLDALFGGKPDIYENGSQKPLRAGINLIGATIADNPGADRLDVTITGSHGNQAGGSLHAVATGSVAGFLSAADKTTLDAATSAATANTIAKRGALGVCSFGALTAPSLSGPAGDDLALTAAGQICTVSASEIDLGADAVRVSDATLTTRLTIGTLPGALLTWASSITSVVDSITKRAGTGANVGAARSIAAQDGQNVAAGTNNNGGNLVLRSGAVGTGGSGGTNGSVTIGTGALDRIQCTATDIGINANGTAIITGGLSVSANALVTGALGVGGQSSEAIDAISPFAASITIDATKGNHHEIATMTANITSLDMTGAVAGSMHTVETVNNGTGGFTITWAAKFKFGTTYTNQPHGDPSHRTTWLFKVKSATDIRCIGKEVHTT
jgi:hypothetical protein